ncbi:MAG: hypothetical protein GC190_08040 [Alphaproteobacteria bacterium]|nr:hypothetical protein [Alphaproteobacteria bacterium]
MRTIAIAALALVALTTSTLPVSADVVYSDGISRRDLLVLLSGFGMTVKDTTEKDSDPWLQARTSKGVRFYVNMYECQGSGQSEQHCNLIQFQAQWQNDKSSIKQDDINAYNLKFVFGRAALSRDGKSVVFDYPMNIKDGVTRSNMKRNVDNWLRVLDDVRSTFKVF